MDPHPKRVIVLAGAPCSGKGTQSKRLCKALGLVHISTGDVFRDAASKSTDYGKLVKAYLSKGNFMPDEIVSAFVRERLAEPDVIEHGCVLDGFPRSVRQAEALMRIVNIDRYLVLEAPKDVLMERASGRRMDPETGEIYNLTTMPPPADAVDRLVQRSHDSDPDAFTLRLNAYDHYQQHVGPVLANKLAKVNAVDSADAIHAEIIRLLAEPPAAPLAAAVQDDDDMLERPISASMDPNAPPMISVALVDQHAVVRCEVREMATYLEEPGMLTLVHAHVCMHACI